jgi:hypothetical protein
MRLRDFGGLLLAAALGALFAAGAGGKMFAPQPWFWPLVAVCGAAGVLVLGIAAVRAHRPALDVVFEGDGTPCVHDFAGDPGYGYTWGTHWENVPQPSGIAELLTGASVSVPATTGVGGPSAVVVPSTRVRHTLVRLLVKNLRSESLNGVRVRLAEARYADGVRAHEYSDFLKWMHDDGEAHVRSLQGDVLDSGDNPHAYMDLATKSHTLGGFCLEFAQPHLRNAEIKSSPVYIHVVATGRDDDGRHVPACHRAFVIEAQKAAGLTVKSKTLKECGFKQ